MKYYFAGASSIYGIEEIRDYFLNKGCKVSFVETESMKSNIEKTGLELVDISDKIEETGNYIIIPLNEYWVSYVIRTANCSRISTKALHASRSKVELGRLLCEGGADYCHQYDIEDAKNKILLEGSSIIVKPDKSYSGHDVKIVSKKNINKFDGYINNAKNSRESTKRILDVSVNEATLFEYIAGVEYSADVLWWEGRYTFVRVCKKTTSLIQDAPCVIKYELIEPSDVMKEMMDKWLHIIFADNDISFAQFDFIIDDAEKRIVPIDFSCRVGGGMRDLLKKTGSNVYLDAIKRIYKENETTTEAKYAGYFQLNILPTVRGRIKENIYDDLGGEFIKFKDTGSYITNIDPSANNRLGIILGRSIDSIDDQDFLEQKCLIGEGGIENGNE